MQKLIDALMPLTKSKTYNSYAISGKIIGNIIDVNSRVYSTDDGRQHYYPSSPAYQISRANMYLNLLLVLKPVCLFIYSILLNNLSSAKKLIQLSGCGNPTWTIDKAYLGISEAGTFDCRINTPMSRILFYGFLVLLPYHLLYLYKALKIDTSPDSFRPIHSFKERLKEAAIGFFKGFLCSIFLDSFWYPLLLPTQEQFGREARYEFGNFGYFNDIGTLNLVAFIFLCIHSLALIAFKCAERDSGDDDGDECTSIVVFLPSYLYALFAVSAEFFKEAVSKACEKDSSAVLDAILAFLFSLVSLALAFSVVYLVVFLPLQPVFNFYVFWRNSGTLLPNIFGALSERVSPRDTFIVLSVIVYLDIFSFVLGLSTFLAQAICKPKVAVAIEGTPAPAENPEEENLEAAVPVEGPQALAPAEDAEVVAPVDVTLDSAGSDSGRGVGGLVSAASISSNENSIWSSSPTKKSFPQDESEYTDGIVPN